MHATIRTTEHLKIKYKIKNKFIKQIQAICNEIHIVRNKIATSCQKKQEFMAGGT